MKNLFIVALGGMLGCVARYLCTLCIKDNHFPYATLTVNIVGSALIGTVTALVIKNNACAAWRLFIATGFCGGFTTFSTFSLDCVMLLQKNNHLTTLLYIFTSIITTITITFASYWLVIRL